MMKKLVTCILCMALLLTTGIMPVQAKEAGTYTIGVSLKNASDLSKASGAAAAIKGGEETIDADGNTTITVYTQTISMYGLTGSASEWGIYPNGKNTTVDRDAVTETKDADGYVTSFSFLLPSGCEDGIYVNMFVDAMNSYVDAYLAFDFSDPVVYNGTYHFYGYGGYDVNVAVTTQFGKITGVKATGANFEGEYANENENVYLARAASKLAESYNGIDMTDATAISKVDTVSGATFSSEAITSAVLNALSLEAVEPTVTVPDKTPDAGIYSVKVRYNTDVVSHGLLPDDFESATLTVDDKGQMSISVPVKGSKSDDTIFVTKCYGYYSDADRTKLVSEDNCTKIDTPFTDENLTSGTKVITDVVMPLSYLGAEYYNRISIYVPAMKDVNTDAAGLSIRKGAFDVDGVLTVNWDTLTKTGDYVAPDTKVTVKKTKITKAKNVKSKKLYVKWSKVSSVTGYKIQYSTDKKFKKSVKTVTKKGYKTVSATIKGLKKKKTYYVRVRAYKTVSGKNYYSSYSSVKKVKIKK